MVPVAIFLIALCHHAVQTIPLWAIYALLIMFYYGSVIVAFEIIAIRIDKERARIDEREDESALFQIENKQTKWKRMSVRFGTYPVPVFLCVPFVGLFIYGLKHDNGASFGMRIFRSCLMIVAVLFLLFVCVFLFFPKAFSKTGKQGNGKKEFYVGKIQKIYLAPFLTPNDAYQDICEYQILIAYDQNGAEKEFITEKTYTKAQIRYLNKLEYIPIVATERSVSIDEDALHKVGRTDQNAPIDFDKIEKYQ